MPEGDPVRAWLFQLRRLARECPLPGPVRINVGITPRASPALLAALRRDRIPVDAVDCNGTPTWRVELDGMMFEWLDQDRA